MELQRDNKGRKAQADAIADRLAAKLARRNQAFRKEHPECREAYRPLNIETKKRFAVHTFNILMKQEEIKRKQTEHGYLLSFESSRPTSGDSRCKYAITMSDVGWCGEDKLIWLYNQSITGSTYALKLARLAELEKEKTVEERIKSKYSDESQKYAYSPSN